MQYDTLYNITILYSAITINLGFVFEAFRPLVN